MRSHPVEPTPSKWAFPAVTLADESGLVCAGGDLDPGTLLAAYRHGVFPMPLHNTIGWWSPDPRGILPLAGLNVSRSLRRSLGRYEVRIDSAFAQVIDACADPTRPDGWITGDIRIAYTRLHEMGWAHSVESWEDGMLVGGLYGVAIGGLFAGESMFHHRTDASKVALVHLVDGLAATGATLLDVQWRTPHLARLGVIEVSRHEYLQRLREAVQLPLAGPWADRAP